MKSRKIRSVSSTANEIQVPKKPNMSRYSIFLLKPRESVRELGLKIYLTPRAAIRKSSTVRGDKVQLDGLRVIRVSRIRSVCCLFNV